MGIHLIRIGGSPSFPLELEEQVEFGNVLIIFEESSPVVFNLCCIYTLQSLHSRFWSSRERFCAFYA